MIKFGKIIFFLFLLFGLVFHFLLFADPNNTKILSLSVGESVDLELEYSGNIHLSKKGVVDLLFLSKRRWQLTAHRNGFVILSYRDLTSTKEHKIHIFVEKKEQDIATKKNLFFCRKGLMCTKDMNLVSGESHDWFFFIKHVIGAYDMQTVPSMHPFT